MTTPSDQVHLEHQCVWSCPHGIGNSCLACSSISITSKNLQHTIFFYAGKCLATMVLVTRHQVQWSGRTQHTTARSRRPAFMQET